MQIASFMHRIVLSPVASLAIPHFPTLSHKRHDFRNKFIERKMYVLIFSSTLSEKISHSNEGPAKCHKCS